MNTLSRRFTLPIIIGGFLILSAVVGILLTIQNVYIELAGVSAAQAVVNQTVTLGKFYTTEVVARAKKAGMHAEHDFAERDSTIPVPATLTKVLGEQIAKDNPGSLLRTYSRYPFLNRKNETYDDFEMLAIAAIEKDGKTPFYRVEEVGGRLSMRYAVAQIMKPACVACHNNHPLSVKKDWKEGDVRGVTEVIIPVDGVKKSMSEKTAQLGILIFVGFGLLTGIIFIVLRRNVIKPIAKLNQATQAVGRGDLTVKINHESDDELGQLAKAFDVMVGKIRQSTDEINRKATELAEKNLNLERATKQLKESQAHMVQSEKMASLGQLTAGIAHEINNPINFVSANVQPLKKDIDDMLEVMTKYGELQPNGNVAEQLKEIEALKQDVDLDYVIKEVNDLLKGIEDGAKRTAEIVKGLRNFSRLGEDDLKKADVHEGLDSTLLLLKNQYKNRIEIIKEYGQLREIECYPSKLNQVFMNIIANAVQAISGNGTISLRTETDGDNIKIRIKDSGMGMSEAVRKKIFEPFFTTKDVGEGTGLGLSIVLGIIESHHGKIDVESEVGKGTAFTITLPIQQPRK